MKIFNRPKIQIQRNKTAALSQNTRHAYAAYEIIENLKELKQEFANILNIGCRNGALTKLLLKQYSNAKVVSSDISAEHIRSMSVLQNKQRLTLMHMDEEEIGTALEAKNQFDLITFSLGLHAINDIQSFLKSIKGLLAPKGIFIGNFIGGPSLRALRRTLMDAEEKANQPHSPHIYPFVNFDHLPSLLQEAGFKEIVANHEVIELEHDSPLALMRAIKNFGESNALVQAANYAINKAMYITIADNSKPFLDEITLINFIASLDKHSININLV